MATLNYDYGEFTSDEFDDDGNEQSVSDKELFEWWDVIFSQLHNRGYFGIMDVGETQVTIPILKVAPGDEDSE